MDEQGVIGNILESFSCSSQSNESHIMSGLGEDGSNTTDVETCPTLLLDFPNNHGSKFKSSDDLKLNDLMNFEEDNKKLPIECIRGRFDVYLKRDSVQREIAARFETFLRNFELDDNQVYITQINVVACSGGQSLEVNYHELSDYHPFFALWISEAPRQMLEIFHESACAIFNEFYPNYTRANGRIYVRICNVPICNTIRDLRQKHLHNLVCISGIVTRRSCVYPEILMTKFNCEKCRNQMGPFLQQNTFTKLRPIVCTQCQSKGPFESDENETIYRNYQTLFLQESSNDIRAGVIPRSKEIIVLDDLVDHCLPGEEVEVVGIYLYGFDKNLDAKNSFSTFKTLIEANHIRHKNDRSTNVHITDEDRYDILTLSCKKDLSHFMTRSIAPHIFGHNNVKMALTLALFGGQEKNTTKMKFRGDINVLLLGDPGVAKSQLLKIIQKIAEKTVYTTGKGTSSVGLTASVQKDFFTDEWILEGKLS
jgi:DNA replication licensing factor MCM2